MQLHYKMKCVMISSWNRVKLKIVDNVVLTFYATNQDSSTSRTGESVDPSVLNYSLLVYIYEYYFFDAVKHQT